MDRINKNENRPTTTVLYMYSWVLRKNDKYSRMQVAVIIVKIYVNSNQLN